VKKTTLLLTALAGLGLGLLIAGAARAQTAAAASPEPTLPRPGQTPPAAAPACPVNAAALTLAGDGLYRSKAAVRRLSRLNILAIGSSSIEGVGASRRDLGFVPMLQNDLRTRLPEVAVNVFNRGIGGESAFETANRLRAEIETYKPDLVIWQVGTNDVLRARPWSDVMVDITRGQAILDAADVDVLLIDPQRLPEDGVNFRGKNVELAEVARLLAVEGARMGYAVQHRFDAMRAWTGLRRGGIGPDDLHMNDDGYACWASVTADSLAAAVR
jgi:lysophospholipase L1-like esterase